MVFEVDNTTEQLISKLQESIQETIYSLESGQYEIKELIDEVKASCSGLATADQADSVIEDISKTRTAMQKLATAEQATQHETTQGKILGIIEQEAQTVAEIKAAFPKVSSEMETHSRASLASQRENTNRLEKLMSELFTSDTRTRLEQLQSLADELNALSSSLGAQMDKLCSQAGTVLAVAEGNKTMLTAIMNYLSLPGYKRLFKGMEVPRDEASE